MHINSEIILSDITLNAWKGSEPNKWQVQMIITFLFDINVHLAFQIQINSEIILSDITLNASK